MFCIVKETNIRNAGMVAFQTNSTVSLSAAVPLLALLLLLLLAVAEPVFAATVDLYLYERTFVRGGTVGLRCDAGCSESACIATRDFRIGNVCRQSNENRWTRLERNGNKQEICEVVYSNLGSCEQQDDDNNNRISTTCFPLNACYDNWVQYHLFPDACMESTVPVDDYTAPFVPVSLHRTEQDCLDNVTTAENYLPADPALCFPTRVLLGADGSSGYTDGSVSMECQTRTDDTGMIHQTRYFTDTTCASQAAFLPTATLRRNRSSEDCSPSLGGIPPYFLVDCELPTFHCKVVDAYALSDTSPSKSSVRSNTHNTIAMMVGTMLSITTLLIMSF